MQDKNPLELAEELAGQAFGATIEDNTFMIRPAEAGIALLAAITQHNEHVKAAWDAADEMADALETLRADNALLREALDSCVEWLRHAGYDKAAEEVLAVLWPVRGVFADGTEVEIRLDWSEGGAE